MPDLSLENSFSGKVVGLDEAGRGPLAGPVVAGCVYIPPSCHDSAWLKKIQDSKKLSPTKRSELFGAITEHFAYGIGIADVAEINQHNILQASFLAMQRAYTAWVTHFGQPADLALIDGKIAPKHFPCPTRTIIQGDHISVSIAAASILAKVTRDKMMEDLDITFPNYGFAKHKGYGTKHHLHALQSHGALRDHHRLHFAPIRKLL